MVHWLACAKAPAAETVLVFKSVRSTLRKEKAGSIAVSGFRVR